MDFRNPSASLFIPDDADAVAALKRTTHLGIGAHQDDLEIMAFHGIRHCYHHTDRWFGGVVCTDGRGSPRSGPYAGASDREISRLRREEQQKAASLGEYGFVAQLDYPSAAVKGPDQAGLQEELARLVALTGPGVVYTHNLADKHESHVATALAAIGAIRSMPPEQRPGALYGCEVWRGLDWMPDEDKICLDADDRDGLGHRLLGVFESQIEGGKRYDLATLGRRYANATYYQPNEPDSSGQVIFATDLSPLVKDDSLDVVDYVMQYIRRFQEDVETRLKRQIKG